MLFFFVFETSPTHNCVFLLNRIYFVIRHDSRKRSVMPSSRIAPSLLLALLTYSFISFFLLPECLMNCFPCSFTYFMRCYAA